ncbi:MAG: hypothetical protein HYV99_06810 [Betaproteobacteria bacterium]|nr:hypothetical protein [Betaproteobacteria bacterium]
MATSQNITIASFAGLQARNLTLIATGGDVNVDAQITKDMINQGILGGSLNLFAFGDVNVNQVAGTNGVTIGRVLPAPILDPATGLPVDASIEKFNHDLKLVARGDINVLGSVYLLGDLRLRANASDGEILNPPLAPTFQNNGGSVNISVPGAFPTVVSAANIIVGTKDALGRPLPVQNLMLTAGTATPGAGARQSASARLITNGSLDVFLTGNMLLTSGNATADNTAGAVGSVIRNSAIALVGGSVVNIKGVKDSDNPGIGIPALNSSDITLTAAGKTATAVNLGVAEADSSAAITAISTATINVGGDITLTGGTATATGTNAIALANAIIESGTNITGTQILTVAADNIILNSGTANSVTGGNGDALAILVSSGAIGISTTGAQGLELNGAAGSGRFDALGGTLVPVTNNIFPIALSGAFNTFIVPAPTSRDLALVVAGAPLVSCEGSQLTDGAAASDRSAASTRVSKPGKRDARRLFWQTIRAKR